jgi:GTP-binding protein Era
MKGIYTPETMQLVFTDTPGVHQGKHVFNKAMLQEARGAVADDVNLVCWLVDLSRSFGEEEHVVAELVRSAGAVPRLVVFNKCDIATSTEDSVAAFYRIFPDTKEFPSVRLSALQGDAKEKFLVAIDPFVPPGPRYFDPDDLTDSTMRQVAAEYIRKQVIAVAGEEVPHAVYVEIESYKESAERHEIVATLHVETNGQRGIIVGKAGSVISRIKRGARTELAKLTGVPVSLTCHVKVSPKWRDSTDFLRRVGVEVQPAARPRRRR